MNIGLNSLLDSAGVAMVSLDRNLRIQYANLAVESLFDTNQEALSGCLITDDLLPETTQSGADIAALLQAQFEATTTLSFEAASCLADGRKRWCLWTVNRQRDSAGSISGLIAVATDVTQQRQAESVTQTQNRILAEIAEGASPQFLRESISKLLASRVEGARCSVHDRSIRVGKQWDVVACGLSVGIEKHLFDFDPIVALGDVSVSSAFEGLEVLEAQGLPDGLGENYQTVWRAGGKANNSLAVILVWFEEANRLPTQADAELLLASIALCSVLAERDLAQFALTLEKDKAVSQAATLSAFISRMSHEVRTPMGGVMGVLDMLRERSDLPADALESMSTAYNASESIFSLLDDVLDMAMIETGELILEEKRFDPVCLVDDVLEIYGAQARSHGVRLLGIVDAQVPSQIIADSARLRQVLMNLLSNAIKFTRHGQVAVMLEVEPIGDEAIKLIFRVRDNGVGLSQQAQSNILACRTQPCRTQPCRTQPCGTEPYRTNQGQEGKSGVHRTGLGLPLSSRLVQLMDGDLTVDSELGSGSEFTFTSRATLAADSREEPQSGGFSGMHVLTCALKGDEPGFMQANAKWLGMTMHKVETPDEVMHWLDNHDAPRFLFIGDGLKQEAAETLAEAVKTRPGCAAITVFVFTKRQAKPQHKPRAFSRAGIVSWVDNCLRYPVSRQQLLKHLQSATRTPMAAVVVPELASQTTTKTSMAHKVLIVEDQQVNCAVARGMLRKLGVECEDVANGQLAVALLMQKDFDLVLMDCEMPIMDGYAATQKIRENESSAGRPAVPVVAMSAHVAQEQKRRCTEAGMDDYLTKPYKLADLQAVLKRWLPEKAATTEPPPADDAVLMADELAEIIDMLEEDFAMLVDSFVAVAPQKLHLIESATLQGDMTTIKSEAHALKGIASTLAARPLAAVCEQLELSASQADRGRIRELHEPLASLVRRSSEALLSHVPTNEKALDRAG